MKTRVISGAFIAIFTLLIVWFGGLVTTLALGVISIIGYIELCRATKVCDKKPNILMILTFAGIVAYYALSYMGNDSIFLFLTVALMMIVHMAVYVIAYPKYHANQIMHSYFSFVYCPIMLSFVLHTRMLSNYMDTLNYNIGFFLVWMIFIAAWFSDTFAYFTGVLFGKHKIFPVLSPKKTVEGCIGGVVGAGIGGLVYAIILYNCGVLGGEYIIYFLIIGLIGSVVGQIGDLAASAIKRNYEIKDYGNLIPGHGGIMDRFDSIIFTSMLIYVLSIIFFGFY